MDIISLQKIALVEGAIAVVLGIIWFLCKKNEIKWFSFAILTYFVHFVTYYICVLFLDPDDVMRWSVLLRLHGITLQIIVLGFVTIENLIKRVNDGKQR